MSSFMRKELFSFLNSKAPINLHSSCLISFLLEAPTYEFCEMWRLIWSVVVVVLFLTIRLMTSDVQVDISFHSLHVSCVILNVIVFSCDFPGRQCATKSSELKLTALLQHRIILPINQRQPSVLPSKILKHKYIFGTIWLSNYNISLSMEHFMVTSEFQKRKDSQDN